MPWLPWVGDGGVRCEINVTPLVDVCLVLLIIFMVVLPTLQVGYGVTTPSALEGDRPALDQVTVGMDRDGRTFLDRHEVPRAQFPDRLAALIAERGSGNLVLFAAAGELPYGEVADFLDLCRHSGAERLGIVFDGLWPAKT